MRRCFSEYLAIKDCRADGTMADFLERHHGEVFGMVSLQWDEEKAKEFYESEARAEGRAEGRTEGKTEMIIHSMGRESLPRKIRSWSVRFL